MAKKENSGVDFRELQRQIKESDSSKDLSKVANRLNSFLTKYKISCSYTLSGNKIGVLGVIMPKTLIHFLVTRALQSKRKNGNREQEKLTPNRLLAGLLRHEKFNVMISNRILYVQNDN